MIRVYVHPRCIASYTIYEKISEHRITGVVFVNTELDPFASLEKGVFAVPAVEKDGVVVLQGWTPWEDVLAVIQGGKVKVSSVEEAFERLLKSVTSSFTVAAAVYAAGDLSIITGSTTFMLSASGAYFLEDSSGFLDYAASRLRDTSLEAVEDGLIAAISGNFARDFLWVFGTPPRRSDLERLGFEGFKLWFTARASMGRVFVPHSFSWPGLEERLKKLWEHLLEKVDVLGAKAAEEQSRIPEGWV
uniref:Thioredoxin n=1 Tax=Thermofilum pendens TaxID=2269 RepID=A0A7C4B9R3_THEPE